MKILSLLPVVVLFLLVACTPSQDTASDAIKPYSQYVSTRGLISKADNIKLVFAQDISLPEDIPSGLVQFSPRIDAEMVRTSRSELVFSPKENLPSGSKYQVKIDLSVLSSVEETPPATLKFEVMPQDFEVSLEPLKTPNIQKPDELEISGVITTADLIDHTEVEKMLVFSGGERSAQMGPRDPYDPPVSDH